MKKVYHPSNERGHANHGWLDSYHSFSFAHWYNPHKMNFGALRVLNDDSVMPKMGFGKHPHSDMEIISIPLSGSLTHRDSMGHSQEIKVGDVQVMSAGTGIEHSEFNSHSTEKVEFLQIWIFPKEKGITPRYDQKSFDSAHRNQQWQVLVHADDKEGEGLKIHQDALIRIIEMHGNTKTNYASIADSKGVYFFVIEGCFEIADSNVSKRDALGVWETSGVEVECIESGILLAIEVPM